METKTLEELQVEIEELKWQIKDLYKEIGHLVQELNSRNIGETLEIRI